MAPALSSKNPNHLADIILKEPDDDFITDNFKISEILDDHYINIVENTSGNSPLNLGDFDLSSKESINQYIDKIISHYKEHPSIFKIISILTKQIKHLLKYRCQKLVILNNFEKHKHKKGTWSRFDITNPN